MILIGENLNIMSQTIGPALKERNPGPVQEMAKAETEAGVDYIDLNIGPARKAGDEMMEWSRRRRRLPISCCRWIPPTRWLWRRG
jgi:cobalamin-dependent methionine synthase I